MTPLIIEIEVLNFTAYNPRADRKSHHWFRLDNGIATEPKFFGLTVAQKFIAICLFAEASKAYVKRGDGTATIHVPWLANAIGSTHEEILETIQRLTDLGVIRLPDGNQSVATCLTTNERTNERTPRTPKAEPVVFDFTSIAKEYPNSKGRSAGIKRLTALIKTQEQFDRFCKAVRAYAKEVRESKTDPKYVKHFSSFVGSDRTGHPFEDFLPPPGCAAPPEKTPDQITAEIQANMRGEG